jgi:hypothetical protein
MTTGTTAEEHVESSCYRRGLQQFDLTQRQLNKPCDVDVHKK